MLVRFREARGGKLCPSRIAGERNFCVLGKDEHARRGVTQNEKKKRHTKLRRDREGFSM